MSKRIAYGLAGSAAGTLLFLGIGAVLNKPLEQFCSTHGGALAGMIVASSAIAVALAQRAGKVQSPEEINRPATILGKERRS
jgi:hypothetical protein